MSDKTKPFPPHRAHAPSTSEVLVLVSMALIVAAVVVGLNVQFGLSLGLSAVAGVSLFIGMLGFHAWNRGEAERAALADELMRLEDELGFHEPAPADEPAVYPSYRDAPVEPVHHVQERPGHADQPRANFEAYRGAPRVAPGQSFTDYTPMADGAEPGVRADIDAALAPQPAVSAVREDDVEMLQRRIKDMLYQVNVAEQARELASAMPEAEASADPVLEADMPVDVAIDALEAAVKSMQKGAAAGFSFAGDAPAADQHLANIRDAIAAGRVDVFLEPILGLGDQAAQHYDVSIRLTGADGEDLGTGDGDIVAGRGLLPLFDTTRISRSAVVAERLQSRGRNGSVFSRTSGEALIAPDFTRSMQLDFVARPATARQLILTFSQEDIRSFRAAEQRAVSALAALGFRFAIAGLTDLDMNFGAMAQVGFGFVKIDASVMLNGLPHPGGHIPASDVCRFLADQGFGLIVEGIDSEETLAKVFGFGALMGQGTLFGGRRPVKMDVGSSGGQAAA